jgi:hypothetical protein
VRSVRRGPDRLHGEVFLYDNVSGGAGYARHRAEPGRHPAPSPYAGPGMPEPGLRWRLLPLSV